MKKEVKEVGGQVQKGHRHAFELKSLERKGGKLILISTCGCGKERIQRFRIPGNRQVELDKFVASPTPATPVASVPVASAPASASAVEAGVQNGRVGVVPSGVVYKDWAGILPVLDKAYELRIPVLIVGPKGTGKTEAVRKWCEERGKKLFPVNFSLRTRESQVLGQQILDGGSVKFVPGILPQSMMEGGVFYADELSYAEPDVLVVIDSALDARREVVLKEAGEPLRIQAHPDWWCVATTNPVTHAGSKELPPQILSRFPVRIFLDYPSSAQELAIIRKHIGNIGPETEEKIKTVIRIAEELRRAEKEGELPYAPSLRETITAGKLLVSGMELEDAVKVTLVNQYAQWDKITMEKVQSLVKSIMG